MQLKQIVVATLERDLHTFHDTVDGAHPLTQAQVGDILIWDIEPPRVTRAVRITRRRWDVRNTLAVTLELTVEFV